MLRRQLATLEKDVLNFDKAALKKNCKILELQSQLETTQHVAKNEKKQATFYEKQVNEKKKLALSVEDQLKLEDAKRGRAE